MQRAVRTTLLMLLIFLSHPLFAQLSLTEQEQVFLSQHPVLTLAVDPDWYPYERLDKEGRYEGIAHDLLQLIAQRSSLKLEIVPTSSWTESIALAREGKVDGLAFLNRTEERESYLTFTEPYFTDPNVIITRTEHPYVANPALLANERVALPLGTSVSERLRREYPNLEQLLVESEEETLFLVERYKADLTVRSLTMAAYVIKEGGHFNLKIAGQFPGYDNLFRIGLQKDLPLLVSILNKGIATLTPMDVQNAVNNHISIKVQRGFDYRLFIMLGLFFVVILLSVIIWLGVVRSLNRKLSRQKEALTRLSRRLARSEQLHRSILRASPDAIILSDQDGTIRMASRVAHALVGLDEGAKLEGRHLQSFIHPSSIEVLQTNIKRLYAGEKLGVNEYLGLRPDGSTFAMETSSELLMSPDKRTIQLIIVVRDVSERRQLEQELVQKGQDLQHLNEVLRSSSLTDSLTGLYNRRYFDEAFAKAYEEARHGETSLALLIIDLDRFKLVNDTFGHAAGDSVLVRIARAIQEKAGPETLLARWGGEEFVLLSKGMSREQVVQYAQQLRVHLADLAHEQVGQITVSIGVATYQGSENVHELFKRADDALYQAKQAGRNCVFSV